VPIGSFLNPDDRESFAKAFSSRAGDGQGGALKSSCSETGGDGASFAAHIGGKETTP
jgi:hypothetical protein